MDQLLLALFLTLAVAAVLSIALKHLGISHIIGYITTGTIISYLFGFNGPGNITLDAVGEFGIVFLMFTIGLELSLTRIRAMRELLLTNGTLQVGLTTAVIFALDYFVFSLDFNTAIVVALAFSLSSTAIVLTYLKRSKDILTPYGQITMGILIFQDLAVIPILLLISFLSNHDLSLGEVLLKTAVSAVAVVAFMFIIGERVVNALLKFSARTELDELFLGAVFAIVIGASLLAHSMGFTYSLGAFIAGMLIADTDYRVKVESDIASYRDLLLAIFFFGVGTKIDLLYFLEHLHEIFFIFVLAMLFKAAVVYAIIRRSSDKNTSAKTALALAQVGEFSFVLFALAGAQGVITHSSASFLILVSVMSMILTPFIVNNIYKFSSFFEKEYYESDVITPIGRRNHIVVAGFATLGKIVCADLQARGVSFVIISDNLKQVLHARKLGYMAYFGHLDKRPVLESLKVDEAKAVILTVSSEHNKRLIGEAVRAFTDHPDIIIKIDTAAERQQLRDVNRVSFVDASFEVSNRLVDRAVHTDS